MSLTTKKRFVMKQAESELFLPNENEIIARVLTSPGRNLHEVSYISNFYSTGTAILLW